MWWFWDEERKILKDGRSSNKKDQKQRKRRKIDLEERDEGERKRKREGGRGEVNILLPLSLQNDRRLYYEIGAQRSRFLYSLIKR